MATIVTRSGKGSPLTNNEVDANFTNLNTELGTKANTSSLATVATTGAYADLTGKPTIASADGSVVVTGTTNIDLSVAVAGSTSNVVLPIRNTTGATLAKGTAVYISGATGQISTVSKAIATGDATSAQTLGLVTANIANNSNGNVTLIGTITNIDTSAYTDGQQLYLSPTTAGTLTATKPYAPQHLVYVAVVEHAHPSQGKLFVKVQNGYEMDELHNVSAQSPANNDGLFYNTSTSLWEKKSIATALGYTPYNATNPAGYITGITSGNVTTALGYTPANKAGDNFTGAVGFLGGSAVASNGDFYARRDSGSTGVYYFAAGVDKYLYWDGGSYNFGGAGPVIAPTSFRAPIFYDSANTGYYVDAASTSNLNAANFNGAVNLDGGTTIWTGSTGLRLKRNTTSATGDDVLDIQIFDSEARLTLDNDNDGDSSLFTFGHMANGARVQTLAFDDVNVSWKGQKIFHDGYHPEADKWTTARTLSLSGDATGSVSWDGSANVTLPVAVVNDSHEHSFNSLLNKTGGTGTYTTSGDFRAPIFYDSNNTAYYVDPNGTTSLTSAYANRYFQSATGAPTANLGDPTVTEMALFDRQFNNKTAFYPEANLKFFTSTDGITWTEYTSFTVAQKKALLGGDAISGVFIPNGTPYFRIEITNNGDYVYLNALYIYWSASGNSSTIKIQKRRASDDVWLQHTNSTSTVSGWPAHVYLPFATIPYISPTSTSASHFDTINIDFQPTWANANNIALYNMEVWGGYPAGSRNIYSTDSDKNVTFPTILGANTDVRAPTFYDSNNTGFYFDGAGTSNLNGLTVGGSEAITVANLDDDNRTYSGHFFLQPYYGAGYYMHVYPNGGAGATSTELNIRTWNGISYTTAQLITSGYSLAAGSYRAPLFYDSNDTAYYVDPANTSTSSYFAGNATFPNTTNVGIRNAAADAYVWVDDAYGNFYAKNASGGFYGDFTGYNFRSASSVVWATMGATYFQHNTQLRAPIFYDSDDTAYYTNPNSTSNLLGLSVTNRISGSINGDAQRLFSHTGANNGGLQYWNTLDNTTLNPNAGYHYGLRMGHGDADTYYSATIAVDFFADNFYLRRKTSGTDQTWRRFWHNGDSTISATGDFRAPIFYDSDNTGFYANFASASADAVYTNGGYSISAGDSKGFRFWNSDDYKIYMSASSNATWGGRVSGETTSDYNMYFRMKSGTNRGFVFRSDTTNVAGIDASGNGRFNSVTANQIYAQIFYDSQNGAYYVDPASTSNRSAVNVNGSAVYRSDWTTRFQSGSDFVDGTLVTTDIPATATNGDSFVIEITGKSYDGSNPPFKVVAQGYLYNDTIINYSGLSYAGNFASYIKVFQDGGVLKFWWPRISYWNSFNVNVMAMDGPSNNTITRNRVTAIANSTEPTGTKKQQINLKGFMRNDVSATNSVDLRAPIFYDSNNTGFYLDPNGTSNLSGLTVANTITGSVTGNAATATTLQTARTINGVSFNGSANITITAAANGGNADTVSSITNITGLGRNSLSAGVVDGLTSTNFRTTMFGNAVGTWNIATSRWNSVPTAFGGLAAYGTAIAWSGSDTHAFLALNYNSSGAKIGGGSGDNINWSADLLHSANYTSYAMPSGSSATNSVDVRAPIFYDSADTYYYVDANSTSRLNNIQSLYLTNVHDVSTNHPYGMFFSNGQSTAYAIYRESGAWTHPYPDLRIAFHTGIKMGANAGYGGMKFYTDYDMSSQVMSINNGADGLGAANVFVNNNLQVNGNIRTPIYYDVNDTFYYINPNSNSVLYKFENINQRVAYDRAWDNYPSITVYNTTDQGPQNDFRIHGIGGANGGDFAVRLLVDGDITSLANINAGGAFYGQGFYDSNNTGYYGDFSSTGTSLNVAGSIVAAGNVTAYSDRRLKNNIQQMTSALDKVSQLLGVTFTRNDLADTTRRYGGLLAQDVEKVLPEAVHDIGGTLGVDYNATIGLLVEAIKELRDEVEMLRK
jgi:hypothetical protein